MGKISYTTPASEELMNIRWERGPGFYNAILEEVEILATNRDITIGITNIDRLVDFVETHYEIDMKDYEETLKINLKFMSYKAAVHLSRRHAARVFSPQLDKIKNEKDIITQKVNVVTQKEIDEVTTNIAKALKEADEEYIKQQAELVKSVTVPQETSRELEIPPTVTP